jgi:hypothetical protein
VNLRRAPVGLCLIPAIVVGGAACRRKVSAPEPAPAAAAPAAPEAESAVAPSAPPAPPPGRSEPPTAEEVRAALNPVLDGVGRCVQKAGAPDGGTLTLRFRVQPEGRIAGAEIVELASATRCLTETLAAQSLPAWHGDAVVFSVLVDSNGQPLLLADAGAR